MKSNAIPLQVNWEDFIPRIRSSLLCIKNEEDLRNFFYQRTRKNTALPNTAAMRAQFGQGCLMQKVFPAKILFQFPVGNPRSQRVPFCSAQFYSPPESYDAKCELRQDGLSTLS
jgi:hypothetical protein